jgi:hypothetical protein
MVEDDGYATGEGARSLGEFERRNQMNARIIGTTEIVSGKTLTEIRSKMCGMLKIDGFRSLTAKADTGAVIHVELFENRDYIISADGRYLYGRR